MTDLEYDDGAIEEVYIGDTVLFYNQGDVNEKPVAALVQDVVAPGLLHLGIMPKHCTTIIGKPNVHHSAAPILKENKNIAIQYGCWDFTRAGHIRREAKDEQRKATARRLEEASKDRLETMEKKQVDETERILLMKDKENMNATEIAEALGQGWSYQRVNAILRKNKRLVAT